MSGPFLGLGITATGVEQVKQLAGAVALLDTSLASLATRGGVGGGELAGLAALTNEVTKIRKSMGEATAGLRTEIADLKQGVAKSMSEAFTALANSTTSGARKAKAGIKEAATEVSEELEKTFDRYTASMMVGSAKYEAARVSQIAKEDAADKKYLYRMMVGSAKIVEGQATAAEREASSKLAYQIKMMVGSVKIAEQMEAAAEKEDASKLSYRIKMMAGSAKIAEQMEAAAQREDAAKLGYRIKMMTGSVKIAEEAEKAAVREDAAKLSYRIKMMTGSAQIAEAQAQAAEREGTAKLSYRIKMMTGSAKIAEDASKAAQKEYDAALAWTAKLQLGSLKIVEAAKEQAAAIDLATRTADAAYERASARAQTRLALGASSQLKSGIAPSLVTQRFGTSAVNAAQATDFAVLKQQYNEMGAAAPKIKALGDQMNYAHSAARGLASGFGALWLTWGAILPLIAGAAVSHAFVQVIQQGAEVQNTFTQIRVLAGATADEVAVLNKEMLDLGRNGQFGPTEIATAMKTLSLAGLNVAETFSAVRDVLNFAVAGDTDIAKAADVMTTVATAFNISADNYRIVGDVISKAAAESKSSVESMGNAFKSASVINQQYGVSLNDTAIGLALLANAGIQNTQAGTALRNMYADLAGRTPKVTKALHELGVETLDINGKMRAQADIFNDLVKALSNYDPRSQFKFVQTIFGERGAKPAQAILNALAQTAKETSTTVANAYEEMSQKVVDHAGFAATAAAQMALTPLNQMKSVVAAMETTLVESFDEMQPQVLEFSRQMKEAFSSESFKATLQSLLSMIAKLTLFVVDHGKAVLTVIGIYVSVKSAAGVVTSLGLAWAEMSKKAAEGVAAIGLASRVASAANPFLLALSAAVTAVAAGWAIYTLWANKANEAKDQGSLNASELLKRLSEEEDRLDRVNEARRRGISLMQLEAEINLAKARNDAPPELVKARSDLAAFDKKLAEVNSSPYAKSFGPANQDLMNSQRLKLQAEVNRQEEAYGGIILKTEATLDRIKTKTKENEDAELARIKETSRAAGDLVYNGPNKTKIPHRLSADSDASTIDSLMRDNLAKLKSGYDSERAMLESKHRNELADEGSYQVQLLQMQQGFAQQQDTVLSKSYEDRAKEYEDRVGAALKTLKGDDQKRAIEKLTNDWIKFNSVVNKVRETTANSVASQQAKALDDTQGEIAKLKKHDDEFLARAGASVKADEELAASRLRLASATDEERASEEAHIKVTKEFQPELERLQREYDKTQASMEAINKEFLDNGLPADEATSIVWGNLRTKAEALRLEMDRLTQSRNALANTAGANAVSEVEAKKYDDARKAAEKLSKDMSGKLADAVLDGGKDGFKDLRSYAVDMFKKPIKVVLEAAFKPFTDALVNMGYSALGLDNAAQKGGFGSSNGTLGSLNNLYSTGTTAWDLYTGKLGNYASQAGSYFGLGPAASGTYAGVGGTQAGADMSLFYSGAQQGGGASVMGGAAPAAGASLGTMAAGAGFFAIVAKIAMEEYKISKGDERAGANFSYNPNNVSPSNPTGTTIYSQASGARPDGSDDTVKTLISGTSSQINDALKSFGSKITVNAFQAGWEASIGGNPNGNGRGGVFSGGSLSNGLNFGESGAGSNYDYTGPLDSKYEIWGPNLVQTLSGISGSKADMDGSPDKLATDAQQAYIEALQAVAGITPRLEQTFLTPDQHNTMLTNDTSGGLTSAGMMPAVGQATGWIRVFDEEMKQRAKDLALLPKKILDLIVNVDPEMLSKEASLDLSTKIAAMVSNVNAFHAAVDEMPFGKLKDMSFDAAAGLVELAGGVDKLVAGLSSYYTNFYSAEEKRQTVAQQIQKRLADVGINLGVDQLLTGTREQFRKLVEAFQGDESDAGQKVYATLLSVSDAFASITAAAQTATEALGSQVQAMQDASKLYRDFESSLKAFQQDLIGGEPAMLSPEAKYNQAKAQFDQLAALAPGDQKRLSGLEDAGRAYLDASKGYYASGGAYGSDLERVKAATAESIGAAGSAASVAEQQLAIAQAQLDALNGIAANTAMIAQTNAQLGSMAVNFASIDTTQNLQLDLSELESYFNISQSQAQRLIDIADADHDGTISALEATNANLAAILGTSTATQVNTANAQDWLSAITTSVYNTWAANYNTQAALAAQAAAAAYANTQQTVSAINTTTQAVVAPKTITFSDANPSGSGIFNGQLVVGGSFDVGTDYVPKDMLAYVHKGERITPAAFNPTVHEGGDDSESAQEIKALRDDVRNLTAVLATYARADLGNTEQLIENTGASARAAALRSSQAPV